MAENSNRSDRPQLSDMEVRQKRARRIIAVFEQFMEQKVPKGSRDSTIEWLERCLLAHEQDTLILALRETKVV